MSEKADILAILYLMFTCVMSLSHVVSGTGEAFDCIDSCPELCILP